MSAPAAEAAYVGASGEAYHGGKRALPPAAVPWVTRARATLFRDRVCGDDDVLEFGCGSGWNLAALPCRRKSGHDVAVQLREVVEAAGIEFLPELTGVPDRSFDVVIAHHSLEHVADPAAVLQNLGRLLRPGGRLLLAVPWEREGRYRNFDPAEPNHHLFSWNVQTLGNLVSVCGYRVEQAYVRRYGYDRRAAQWAVRLGWGEAGFRCIRRAMQGLRPFWEVVVEARRGSA